MTYVVPDDWYANHNLAPGDARLPQKPMQPEVSYSASKGLQPTPPMRGYFGPRPPQPPPARGTTSPYAVSDVMWGIHGLGAVPMPVQVVHRPGHFERQVASRTIADMMTAALFGLGADGQDQAYANADAVLAAASKKITRDMQISAAAASGVAIGLACIPLVGAVLAPLFSIVSGISSAHYKQAAAKVMADCQNTLTQLSVAYTTKQQAVLDAVFEQEKDAAIQLALSGQALNGLGAFGGLGVFGDLADIWSKLKSAGGKVVKVATSPATQLKAVMKVAATPLHVALQAVTKIAPASVSHTLTHVDAMTYGKVIAAGNTLVKTEHVLTGEDILDKANQASAQAIASFRAVMDKQLADRTADAQSEAYRAALRITIAKAIRNNPDVGSLVVDPVTAQNASAGQLLAAKNIVDGLNNPFLTVLPGIVAAGAVVVVLGAHH